MQEFVFPGGPVQARYVQLFIPNNYGSIYGTRVNTFQVLTPYGANVARLEGVGAFVMSASSQSSPSNGPQKAIDFSSSTLWGTANGQVTDQWFKVLLIEGAPYLIDRVRLEAPAGNNSPKDFEIRVSNATLADADFVTILNATLPNDGLPHWFTFPVVDARYVQLFIRDNYGGTTIQVKSFQVYSPELGGATVPFDDFSRDPLGVPIVAWSWDFGDGMTSNSSTRCIPSLRRATTRVRLTVTNQDGLTSSRSLTYTVLKPPAADFTWSPEFPNEGQTTNFTDRSTGANGPILAWRWQFTHTSNEPITQNSSTSFPDNGEHLVTLTVTDNQLLTASVRKSVTVSNAPPTASSGVDQMVVWGENWSLTASISDPGETDRTSLVCDWTFGDGQSTHILNCNTSTVRVLHAYSDPGVYTATLTVTDKDGASASDTLITTVDKRESFITASLEPIGSREVTTSAKLEECFSPHTPLTDKTITFTHPSQTLSTTTDVSGTAEVNITLPSSIDNLVTATFAGDSYYYGSEALAPNLILNGSFEYSALPQGRGYISVRAGSDEIDHWKVTIVDVHYMGPCLVPDGDRLFEHTDEGPDDMPAHVRAILTDVDLTLPVTRGDLAVGTWQGVYLWEHRRHGSTRRVTVTVHGEGRTP